MTASQQHFAVPVMNSAVGEMVLSVLCSPLTWIAIYGNLSATVNGSQLPARKSHEEEGSRGDFLVRVALEIAVAKPAAGFDECRARQPGTSPVPKPRPSR